MIQGLFTLGLLALLALVFGSALWNIQDQHDITAPQTICMECRIIIREGTQPPSHVLCPKCNDRLWAELKRKYPSLSGHPYESRSSREITPIRHI